MPDYVDNWRVRGEPQALRSASHGHVLPNIPYSTKVPCMKPRLNCAGACATTELQHGAHLI